jgi:hypothetical protein
MVDVHVSPPGARLVEYALDGTRVEPPLFDGHSFHERLERGAPHIYRIVAAGR